VNGWSWTAVSLVSDQWSFRIRSIEVITAGVFQNESSSDTAEMKKATNNNGSERKTTMTSIVLLLEEGQQQEAQFDLLRVESLGPASEVRGLFCVFLLFILPSYIMVCPQSMESTYGFHPLVTDQ
jgi:hypothetical protein